MFKPEHELHLSLRIASCLHSKEQKHALAALLAFITQINQIGQAHYEPFVARKKLEFMQKQLNALEQTQLPLLQNIKQASLDTSLLQQIIDAADMDIDIKQYPSERETLLYLTRKFVSWYFLLADIFAIDRVDSDNEALLRSLALHAAYTYLIRNVGADAYRHCVYIPQQLLEQYGLNQQQLLNLQPQAKMSELFARLKTQANNYYQQSQAAFTAKNFRPLTVAAKVNQYLLNEIANLNYDVLTQSIRLPVSRIIWLCLKG